MKVTFYTMQDGDPWGFFIRGHINKADAIVAFNEAAKDRGFKPIEEHDIEHTFGAIDPSDNTEHNYHIVSENFKGAEPITYIDGEFLVLAS